MRQSPGALPAYVRMVEVGPRDGLQNEARTLDADVRIALIERLADAGLEVIEAGSFVSPKWVAQMANTDAVLAGLGMREGVRFPVLVPNMQGFEAAKTAGAREIAVFAAASESFSLKNVNCGIDENLERIAPVAAAAAAEGIAVRGYVSCVLGCPYEGGIDSVRVRDVAKGLIDLGCYEISLGDTIGTGTPGQARSMVERVAEAVPVERLAAHFHDTYGQALANILAVMQAGVGVIDSSVAGLGGCPYAKGASGNVASEDVLYMLNGLGIETGVDMAKLLDAGRYVCAHLGREPSSKVARALAGMP